MINEPLLSTIEKNTAIALTPRTISAVNKTLQYAGYAALIGLGTASCYFFYITPTQQYAQQHYPNKKELEVLFEYGTTGGSILVTISTANLFIEKMNVFKYAQKRNLIILSSILSSLPYALLELKNNEHHSLGYRIATSTLISFTNTITHLVPLTFLIADKTVRKALFFIMCPPALFLSIPIKNLYQKAIQSSKTPEECLKEKEQQQKEQHEKMIHDQYVHHLEKKLDQLKQWLYPGISLAMTEEKKQTIANIQKIIEYLHSGPHTPINHSLTFQIFNYYVPEMIGILGGSWALFGGAGFVKIPNDQLSAWTGSTLHGSLVNALPAAALESLLFFFGYFGFKKTLNMGISFLKGETVMPIATKRYPLLTFATFSLAFLMASFSYSTAALFIEKGFNEKMWPQDFRNFLLISAQATIPVFGIGAYLQEIVRWLEWLSHQDWAGTSDEILTSKTLDAIQKGIDAVRFSKSADIVQDLKSLEDDQLENVLGMTRAAFEQPQDHERNLAHTQPGCWDFFKLPSNQKQAAERLLPQP